MKRISVLLMFFAAIMMLPLSALAQDLHAPHEGTASECPALWHFVHNQIPGAEQGTLTAQFQNAGTVSVSANKVLQSVQHYDIVLNSTDVLIGASDNIEGGMLVLSSVTCVSTNETTTTIPDETTTTTEPPDETTTTTTEPEETTTTTTEPDETTTTEPNETTTTTPDDPWLPEELPNTGGGIPALVMAGLGAVLATAGVLVIRRSIT